MRWCDAGARARAAGWVGGDALAKMSATAAPMKPKKGAVAGQSASMVPGILQRCGRVLRREVPAREAGATNNYSNCHVHIGDNHHHHHHASSEPARGYRASVPFGAAEFSSASFAAGADEVTVTCTIDGTVTAHARRTLRPSPAQQQA